MIPEKTCLDGIFGDACRHANWLYHCNDLFTNSGGKAVFDPFPLLAVRWLCCCFHRCWQEASAEITAGIVLLWVGAVLLCSLSAVERPTSSKL